MTVVALVPVQRLAGAKSRLAAHRTPEERLTLVLRLLDNVLGALTASRLVDETIVVSPDAEVLGAATVRGARGLLQPGSGLNAALRLGRDLAIARGATTLLIVLADLPLLTTYDVDELLREAGDLAVVIAPDRHGSGTNAMVLEPPDAIEPAFGRESLGAHRAAVRERGLTLREYHAAGTGFDVDTVEDLNDLDGLLSGAGTALGGSSRINDALRRGSHAAN